MIKKIKTVVISLFILNLFHIQPAYASVDITSLYTPAAIIHEVLLVCSIICLAWAMKVLSLVRGGLLSKSWQMFVLGFCFLIAAQLMAIAEQAGLIIIPGYVTSAIYLPMALTWLLGLYQIRKVLG